MLLEFFVPEKIQILRLWHNYKEQWFSLAENEIPVKPMVFIIRAKVYQKHYEAWAFYKLKF